MIALLDHKTLIFYSIACNLALLSVLVHTRWTRRSYPGFTTWIAATGSYAVTVPPLPTRPISLVETLTTCE
jgi:hypothetical protein